MDEAKQKQPKQVIFLNGPPKCGKDTVASHLVSYLRFEKMKFAAPLKRMAAGLLNISLETVERLKEIEFKALSKETLINERALGSERYEYGEKDTLRRFLIRLSEEFLKPTYGSNFFGRIAVRELQRSSNSLIIFTDSGFTDETKTVIRATGQHNTILIRLHRNGCNYEKDSRSYLPDIAGTNIDVENNGPLSHTVGRVARDVRTNFGITLLKDIELYDDR